MDSMNSRFQALLQEKNFLLRAYEEEEEWIYRGKLALSETHVVPFSVSISKGEKYCFAQVSYQKIAYIKSSHQFSEWYELLNEVNRDKGMYYSFSLDHKGEVFARYVTQVSQDWDHFFNILVQGATLIQSILPIFEEHFGKFVRM